MLVVPRTQTQTALDPCGGLGLGSRRDQAAVGGISDAPPCVSVMLRRSAVNSAVFANSTGKLPEYFDESTCSINNLRRLVVFIQKRRRKAHNQTYA